MNVFLSTTLFASLVNAQPLDVDIHYARAWSLFPTRIVARDLSIRGTDSNVQWILRLDEVTFDCALRDLLFSRRFHVTRARGSGISFRLRRTVLSPLATEDYVAGLPPVDGLGPVGLAPSDPPYRGTWSDAHWHLWSVQLDDTIADQVREVWFDWARLEGDSRVSGSFRLKPIREVAVGPLDVDVVRGTLTWKGRPALTSLALDATAFVEPFDPRLTEGDDLVQCVTVDATGRGRVPDVGAVMGGSRVAKGAVNVDAVSIHVAQGMVRSQSVLDATAPAIEVHAPDLRVRAGAHLAVRIDRGDLIEGRMAGDATLDLRALEADVGARSTAVVAGAVTASASAPELDLAHPVLHALAIAGGVRVRTESLSGRVDLRADLANVDLDRRDAEIRKVRLEVRDVLVSDDTTAPSGWYANVSVPGGKVRFGSRPRLDADLSLSARDSSVLLDAIWGHAAPSLIARAAPMPGLGVEGHLRLEPDLIVLSDVEASGGDVALEGVYVARGQRRQGAVVVKKGIVEAGLELAGDGGPGLRLFGLEDWFRDERRRAMQIVTEDRGATRAR